MLSRYEADPDMVDDNQYCFTPGLDRTRTGPRGYNYWESRDRYDSSDTAADKPRDDSYRPSIMPFELPQHESYRPRYRVGTQDDPFRSSSPSSQAWAESERQLQEKLARDANGIEDPPGQSDRQVSAHGPDRHSSQDVPTIPSLNNTPQKSSAECANGDSVLSDSKSPMQMLNQWFAEVQRNRSSDEAADDDPFDWRDTRRSDEHLPSRRDWADRFIKEEPADERPQTTGKVYRGSRRTISRKQDRRIKQEEDEDEEEGESTLFSRDTEVTTSNCSTSPSAYDADSSSEDSRRPQDIRGTTPPNFPVPPMGQPEIPGACMCPINKECPARGDHLIDCRTLVVEWKRWNARQVEGGVEVIPEDVDPNDETFVDVHEAARIVHLISEVSRHPAANRAIGIAYNLIRAWIEKMSLNSITENDLHGSNALPTLQAFLSGANTPTRTAKRVTISIQEDLTILMRKWEIGDYGQLPRRGLRRSDPGNTRSPFHPDRTWPFRRGAKYFGNGQLVNGQKWNSRAAMARDGAHGPLIAGISGGKHTGAYSVVMGYHDTYRHDFYADIDCGNRIFYLSTALKAPETDESGNHVRPEPTNHIDPPDAVLPDPKLATPGAQTLMMSHGTGEPVRVFRSFRSAKICPHRPKKGFRYDGLYQVVNFDCLKVDRQIYRFEMVRLDEGQGPIRSGIPAERISGRERQELRTRGRRVRRERDRAVGGARRR